MGSGKTTVGGTLARRTGLEFIDLDAYLEKKLGAPVSQIFQVFGEATFREQEAAALKQLCGKICIVACGGGTMTDGKNYGTVKLSGGTVVFINTSFKNCYERIKDDKTRPLADGKTKAELKKLYDTRLPLYKKNSDAEVSGDSVSLVTAASIMEEIIKIIDSETDSSIENAENAIQNGEEN
jgi:shikimate kinase